MPRAPDPLEILKLDRERVLRLATQTSPARMRKILAATQKDLDRRLRSRELLVGARGEDTFTTTQMRATLAQVREALKALEPAMKGEILATAREAAELQAEGSLRYLDAAERRYRGIVRPLPLDHAAVLDVATKGAEASALRRISSDPMHRGRPGILERYGEEVIGRFERQMQLRVVARRSIAETRDALIEESPFLKQAPLHWAERIARTEAINASNQAGLDTILEASASLDGMLKILSATFDGRTAADSYAVHGQIRRPSEPFDTWQGAVMHPPARPNDREIVVPHRMSWSIPSSLKPRSDGEVSARWAAEGRKGSPPRRPRMSTVDIGTIGRPPPNVAPPVPAEPPKSVAKANDEPTWRSVAKGVRDEELDYMRGGYVRPGSVKVVRGVYAEHRKKGLTPTEIATGVLDPIKIVVEPSGQKFLVDGTHRWREAHSQGAKAIRAVVERQAKSGKVRWAEEMNVPIEGGRNLWPDE